MKVLISTTTYAKFDPEPLNVLKRKNLQVALNPYGRSLKKEELLSLANGACGLIAGTEGLDADVLCRLNKLKVISRCGTGMDNIDLKKAAELKIKVFNTPDAPVAAVAELAIGLVINALRKISLMDRRIRNGQWMKVMGTMIAGKRVGIIGMGRIGKKVAAYLKAFGAEIYFSDPQVKEAEDCPAKKIKLDELLGISDIVMVHMSSGRNNKYLIDAKKIALMKKTAVLINCARGGIVDESALYQALKSEKIIAAALDVFETEPYAGPLKELDNVILTPHIGSYAAEARIAMEKEAAFNLLEGLGL